MFIFACLYFLIFFTIMFCFCDLKNILKYTHTLWCFLFFKALKSKEARSGSLRLLTSTLRPFSRLFRVFPKTYVRSQAEERCRPDPAPGNCTGNQGPSPAPQNRAPWGPASWPRSIGATGLCVWFVLSPDVPPAFPLRSPGLGSPPPSHVEHSGRQDSPPDGTEARGQQTKPLSRCFNVAVLRVGQSGFKSQLPDSQAGGLGARLCGFFLSTTPGRWQLSSLIRTQPPASPL